jgi:hypothetical protein
MLNHNLHAYPTGTISLPRSRATSWRGHVSVCPLSGTFGSLSRERPRFTVFIGSGAGGEADRIVVSEFASGGIWWLNRPAGFA